MAKLHVLHFTASVLTSTVVLLLVNFNVLQWLYFIILQICGCA